VKVAHITGRRAGAKRRGAECRAGGSLRDAAHRGKRPAIAFRTGLLILPRPIPRRLMSGIESPCNKVCTLDPITASCIGCGRTLAEIGAWSRMSDAERARIMAELPRRLEALQQHCADRADLG